MNLKQYQALAARTINPEQPNRDKLINFAFGLAGESGETIDLLKKHLFHGHELDLDKLSYELGDIMWYVAGIATAAGLDLERIGERNIAKLRARYPEGFDTEKSRNRQE